VFGQAAAPRRDRKPVTREVCESWTDEAIRRPVLILVMMLAGCSSAPNQAGSKDPARLEGEPISINAPGLDPKSRDYFTRVSQMIRAKWSYPYLKDETTGKCEYKPAELPAELMARAKPSIGGVTIRAKLQYKLVTSTPCGDGAACD